VGSGWGADVDRGCGTQPKMTEAAPRDHTAGGGGARNASRRARRRPGSAAVAFEVAPATGRFGGSGLSVRGLYAKTRRCVGGISHVRGSPGVDAEPEKRGWRSADSGLRAYSPPCISAQSASTCLPAASE
jgi:hypothetical protein